MCESLGKDQQLSVEQRHSVMKHIRKIIRCSTSSCVLLGETTTMTTKQEKLALKRGFAGFPLNLVTKASLGAEAATQGSVGLERWQKRSPGGEVVKTIWEREVLQLGLSERSEDRWWINNGNTHSSSKGSMTDSSRGVSWLTHSTYMFVQSPNKGLSWVCHPLVV